MRRPPIPLLGDMPDDPDRLEATLRAARFGDPPPEPGPECLDADLIAAVVDGAVDPRRREHVTRHVADCAACRRALASVAAALEDPEVRRAVAAAEPPSRSRRTRFTAPAAAAAAILFLVVLGRQSGDVTTDSTHRAPAIAPPSQPLPIAPLGPTPPPESLRWRSVAGADLYRITLYSSDGSVLYARELRDTAAALPDSVELAPGRSYHWLVEARTGWSRWSASDLFEFSVGRGSAR